MQELPKRFYSLDVLRGLAALTIVLTHWSGFFFYHGELFETNLAPLHSFLGPVYENGWRAVDLFFCLSGFIFFWLYAAKIKASAVSAKEFFVLRFSRLYPLHLVTLLLVAGGQLVMARIYGSWFIIGNNDLKHFLLQMFFISKAGADSSYNGPSWSVTIEIFLYAVFFIACKCRCIRWWHLLIYAGLGEFWFIHHGPYLALSRGVLCFFIGGLSFQAFQFLLGLRLSAFTLRTLAAATLILWVLIPLEVKNNYLYSAYETIFSHGHSGALDYFGRGLLRFSIGAYELVLFPLTIITLALWETRRGTLGRRLAILGDISYSTYLLHFPLQILFMIAAFALGISTAFFSTLPALLLFFSVLIVLSLASHHFLERPAQSFLRSRLLPAKKRQIK